ncbi:MAG: glycosyltransferase family 39 protein [Anaerolineae bacterium]|nr:glycosyltransferase family 39 protein [Anaerolineae bacterium]
MKRNRCWLPLLLLGLLVAFALRAYRLGDQNIWWDEGLAIWAVRHSFVETTLWTAGDVHPPLYFWLLWPWVRLAGESEFAARYLTALVAMLTVAAMAPLGRRLGGPWAGVAALWLLALSRFHVWWSQEMRMYALAALAATLSFYFLLRWISEPQRTQRSQGNSRKPLRLLRSLQVETSWVGATVAALYTIYFSALLLVVQNLYVFIVGLRRADRWALWRRWLMMQGVALALWAPWLALALPRMRSWSVVQEPVPPGFVFLLDGVLLSVGISTQVEHYLWAVLVLLAVLLWGTMALLSQARRAGALGPVSERLWLLALGTLLPPLMVWLVTQPRMLFYTPRVEARYFLSFAPLFYAWLGWAMSPYSHPPAPSPSSTLLERGRKGPEGPGVGVRVALAFALMLWALPGHYANRRLRDDLQSMVRAIWAQARPGDAVVLVSGDRYPMFLYYYDRAPAPADRPPVYLVPRKSLRLDAPGADEELAPIAEAHTRIWLAQVERHLQDPEGAAEAWLAERYTRLLALEFGHNRLSLFGPAGEEVTADGAHPQYPLFATPVAGLEVLGYDLPVREVRPGDPLRLGLYLRAGPPLVPEGLGGEECFWYWTARSSLPGVMLVEPSGEMLWGTLLTLCPPNRTIYRLIEFPVTACMPAGRYHFELTAPDGKPVPLGEVQVTQTQPDLSPAEIPRPMAARLGESIQLVGYGLYRDRGILGKQALAPGAVVRPGEHLLLDLYWQADGPVGENYVVFTHLVGATHNPATGNPVWAQDDHEPLRGGCPTSLWISGRLLRDRYELILPADTPAGEYLLEVGMYRWDTGERLPVSGDGADPPNRRILLGTVKVER